MFAFALTLWSTLASATVIAGTPGPIVFSGDESRLTLRADHPGLIFDARGGPAPEDYLTLRAQGAGEFLLSTRDHEYVPVRAFITTQDPRERGLIFVAARATAGNRLRVVLGRDGLASLGWRDTRGRWQVRMYEGEIDPELLTHGFDRRHVSLPKYRRLTLTATADWCARWLAKGRSVRGRARTN